MWYTNSYRRHLCDMHIEDWDKSFLSEFSPEEYCENLKRAKVQNAMIYLQSHVGLCYFPTKSGMMHKNFEGREDLIKRTVDLCRESGISVTGYYSLIYNNRARQMHPEWRIVPADDIDGVKLDFISNGERYGLCCPNNPGYRAFVSEQIKEMMDYFTVDGMFFDMLFWPKHCYCEHCRERYKNEVGTDIPMTEDWNDSAWLKHVETRRRWMGEFAQSVTDEVKSYNPNLSVEHNVAYAALPSGNAALAEAVLDACDYAGGDVYGGMYQYDFTCKFYHNITKNQPFEYMFSRCQPSLSMHTITKSEDAIMSAVMMTAAHHGATLAIDAIDPVGTMDSRFYERLGNVFGKEAEYEKYFKGNLVQDLGIYYTMRSKFSAHNEKEHINHFGCTGMVETMIKNNVATGICGGWYDLNKYGVVAASCLTEEDTYDYDRICKFVKDGGSLYISGGDCAGLLKEFFGAKVTGRTRERMVYLAPKANSAVSEAFGWFNEKYPLPFAGTAPIVEGIDEKCVVATVKLPYTDQDTIKFASIHSNPPGISTNIPAMAVAEYGKGKVLWSALPIETLAQPYHYGRVLVNLFHDVLGLEQTIVTDAPADVDVVAFSEDDAMTISSVLLTQDEHARRVEPFTVCVKSDKAPKKVLTLPEESECEFTFENGMIKYAIDDLKIFDMKKIVF